MPTEDAKSATNRANTRGTTTSVVPKTTTCSSFPLDEEDIVVLIEKRAPRDDK